MAVGIKVRDNESIDRALRRFKRAVNRSRVLRMYRANMAYTKAHLKSDAQPGKRPHVLPENVLASINPLVIKGFLPSSDLQGPGN